MTWFQRRKGYNRTDQHIDEELREADAHIINALYAATYSGQWSRRDLNELADLSRRIRMLTSADIYRLELEEILE